MQDQWIATEQRLIVEFVPLHCAQMHSFGYVPLSQKRLPRIRRGDDDVGSTNRVLIGIHRNDLDFDEIARLAREFLAICARRAENSDLPDPARFAYRHDLCASLPARADQS